MRIKFINVMILLGPLLIPPFTYAQRKKDPAQPAAYTGGADLAGQVATSRSDLIKATQDYRASLEKLLGFQEREVTRAAETVRTRKELLDMGAIARQTFEECEAILAMKQGEVDKTRQQLTEADHMLAEIQAAEQLAKSPKGANDSTFGIIRFNGSAHWSLSDASKVKTFFLTKFGHPLPISAFGQTAVHDRLGFDHRNAIDVALHPDSVEGRALMEYLRSLSISFIAFRYEVPGSATGAHIHIGRPSNRIS